MPPVSTKSLKGRAKAAALLIALGPEVSAEVLKHFKETEIETLTYEIFQLEKISEETKGQVLEECYHMAVARDFITSGGADYARDMLQRALGKEKAQEVIERLAQARRPQRFGFARDSDPSQLAQFISGEHPQTIALILSHLQAMHAAQTMTHLPIEKADEGGARRRDGSLLEHLGRASFVAEHRHDVAPHGGIVAILFFKMVDPCACIVVILPQIEGLDCRQDQWRGLPDAVIAIDKGSPADRLLERGLRQ